MFDDLVVSGAHRQKTHTRWTILVSLIGQLCILTVLILIPLIYTQALPTSMLTTMLTAPPPPPPAPPPPPKAVAVVKPPPSFIQHNQLIAPKVIPKNVTIVKEKAAPPSMDGMTGGVVGGATGGSAGGVMGGIIGSTGPAAPPPPPKKTPEIIHVGGDAEAARCIRKVTPIYPEIAQEARIQGTVVFHAIIGKDGTVQQLTYISGPPLLVQAAKEAIEQWRYQPELLNGVPVEVDTVISAVFTLGGQ